MFVFKERTCLYSVGTEGSVQFLRLCSLHETTPHIKSQSFSSSLPSVTVPFFLFSQSGAFYKCVLKCSASLPALLWNCNNKQEAPVLQGALHWMFFILRNWKEERDAPYTVQSQVLHVKHYKYEAEQNSLRMKRFWFSTHGSHHVSFGVINEH